MEVNRKEAHSAQYIYFYGRHTLHNKFIFMVDQTFSDRSENFKVQPNLLKVCKSIKAFFYTCLFYAIVL